MPNHCLPFAENIFRLYRRVQELGGYQTVCGRRQWRHLFSELGLDTSRAAAGTSLRRCYEKYGTQSSVIGAENELLSVCSNNETDTYGECVYLLSRFDDG